MVSDSSVKLGLVLLLLFSLLGGVYSVQVSVSIDESSELVQLPEGAGYSLVANGVLEVYNPSVTDKVYEFRLPLALDSFIGINKVSLGEKVVLPVNVSINSSNFIVYTNYTNYSAYLVSPGYSNWTWVNVSSYVSSSDKFDFSYNEIKGYLIEPNETVRVGYQVFGLLDYNLYETIDDSSKTVLGYYITGYDFLSRMNIKLDKMEREDYVYNSSDGSLIASPGVNRTNRLVSTMVSNPTDFDYLAREIKLYRTLASDPFFDHGEVVETITNVAIPPLSLELFDIIDNESPDNAVYWTSYDVNILSSVVELSKQDFRIKTLKNNLGGSGGFKNYVFKPVNHSLIVKKEASKTLIANGEEFDVYLRVINPHDLVLGNLTLFDEIPVGYEIKDVSERVSIENRKLAFAIDDIEEYETLVLKYTLVAQSTIKGITYLKPARVVYGEEEYFSEGVLLVNDLLPTEKIFIQKEVKYVDDNFAKVTITVKNLGNYKVEDLLVTDFIPEDAILKDLTQVPFERGAWRIKVLKAGEDWVVEYYVSRNDKLDSLPNVFGVEKKDVYGTLIFSEEIVTAFSEQPKIVEKVGLGLAVGILIVYLLF